LDTSGVVAAIDPRQEHHRAAAAVLLQPQQRILSPFVLAELDYLIASNAGQSESVKLLKDVADGIYQLAAFDGSDVGQAISIVERYRDLELGIADASVVVLAERFGCSDLLTLDQRHFRTVSGPSGRPFRLLPFDGTQGFSPS
jgi:predicted nucleic acid-binding protein